MFHNVIQVWPPFDVHCNFNSCILQTHIKIDRSSITVECVVKLNLVQIKLEYIIFDLNISKLPYTALNYLKWIYGYVGANYILWYLLRNFSSRCRMWWDRYLKRYWCRGSSTYPICCTDFGTISLLYLCMNVFVVYLY